MRVAWAICETHGQMQYCETVGWSCAGFDGEGCASFIDEFDLLNKRLPAGIRKKEADL